MRFPRTKPYATRLKKPLKNTGVFGRPLRRRMRANRPEKGVFGRLADPAKRHYTFARRRLM